jgi:hypothetical protein
MGETGVIENYWHVISIMSNIKMGLKETGRGGWDLLLLATGYGPRGPIGPI